MRKTLLFVSLILAVAGSAFGQAIPTRTTLSAAVSAGVVNNRITVASATGITASTSNWLLIDNELMRVTAVSSTTLTVTRAQNSTIAAAHVSGATVIYGPSGAWSPSSGNVSGVFIGDKPSGTCARATQQYLPVFNVSDNAAYNCIGGKWQRQTMPDNPSTAFRQCNFRAVPTVVSTTGGAGTVYISSIYVPYTRWYTGISVLNGATVGTSLTLVDIYDNAGSLLHNSATAGISGGTASVMWDISFVSGAFITGPAQYFVGVQNTGATATFGLAGALMSYGDIVTKATAGTFGTLPSIVVPSTYASVSAPVMCLF